MGLIVVIALLIMLTILSRSARAPGPAVTLKGHTYRVAIADTPQLRAQGLSGTANLGKDHGMLFSFQTPETACFWVKDMRYDLDILWFDANNKLTKIETDLSPSTYPNSYCPPAPVTHVLELNAGTVQALHVSLGDTITLPKQ
jgi:uncharacterized membrane protein (UPF0127 family)